MDIQTPLKPLTTESHPSKMFRFVILGVIGGIILLSSVAGIFIYRSLFDAPSGDTALYQFTVGLNEDKEQAAKHLKDEGFIKSERGFLFALGRKTNGKIKPGGYRISKSMSAWSAAGVLTNDPYLVWIQIPEGLRKEEIADILQKELGWPSEETQKWISAYTTTKYEYTEGVYFPDTYLIPRDESPEDVAKRFQTHFEEKFADSAKEALKQNIRWYTLLRIASIVQREAAGTSDMPAVAGILWNRLLAKQKLEIDASLQYARGKTDTGWWGTITPEDKKIDSPYNTYKHAGLPPHPISNPGLNAINAVLFPAKTECFFYLHDTNGDIHCAKTYEEHEQNIEKYL